MKIKNIIMLLLSSAICIPLTITAFAKEYYRGYTYEEWNSAILGHGYYYADDGYDVKYEKSHTDDIDSTAWIMNYTKSINGYTVMFSSNFKSCQELRIKVPDSFSPENKGYEPTYVKCIKGSCGFKEFDLNPKNKYMSLIDNVVFSKDGKTLMSYAQFDDRKVYEIPDGTKTIAKGAFDKSENLVEIIIPNSVEELSDSFSWMEALEKINIPPLVEELPDWSFTYCYNLKEVYIPKNSKLKKIGDHVFAGSDIKELTLPSFDIEIGSMAFLGPVGHVDTHFYEVTENLKLKSYVKPEVKTLTSQGTQKLTWDKIPKATRYEVYQKMKDGNYKLIKETTGTSLKLNNIKKGKQYTFAVKPIAEIRALNTSVYVDKDYEFYYTIEGTMSDDVTVVG